MSRVLKSHTGWVRSVHADSQHIVSGSRDKTVRVWSLADGKLLRPGGHSHSRCCMQVQFEIDLRFFEQICREC